MICAPVTVRLVMGFRLRYRIAPLRPYPSSRSYHLGFVRRFILSVIDLKFDEIVGTSVANVPEISVTFSSITGNVVVSPLAVAEISLEAVRTANIVSVACPCQQRSFLSQSVYLSIRAAIVPGTAA